jgi:hypothetical protein
MTRNLIIVGRTGILGDGTEKGQMASMLCRECTKSNITHVLLDGAPLKRGYQPGSIVVYLSSKERFPSVLSDCQKLNLPLIVVSSAVKLTDIPEDVTIPVIVPPNLGLLIQSTLDIFETFGPRCKSLGAHVAFAEAHQASKTSPPSTMHKIVDLFGGSRETIGHVRSDGIAEAMLDIPTANIGGYGKHFVKATLRGQTVWIQFETIGRQMYFDGLLVYVEEIERRGASLLPGAYGGDFITPPSPAMQKLMDENADLKKRVEGYELKNAQENAR